MPKEPPRKLMVVHRPETAHLLSQQLGPEWLVLPLCAAVTGHAFDFILVAMPTPPSDPSMVEWVRDYLPTKLLPGGTLLHA